MKEQDIITARELNKWRCVGIEFKVTVIKILTGVKKRVDDIRETFTKEIKKRTNQR